jgi:peptide/nickel transport system permease protein
MQQYIARRILLNFVVLFFVATIVFAVLRIDSDGPVRIRAAGCFEGYDECVQIAKEELGLDRSIPEQYGDYLWKIVRLDLGKTNNEKEPVLGEIGSRAWPSIELGILQIVVALTIALPVGIVAAIRQDSWMDYVMRFMSIAFLGIPVFVLAVFVILVTSRFAGDVFFLPGWLPDWVGTHQTNDWVGIFDNPIENIKRVLGAALVGGLGTGAIIMRFLRSQMLEVLRQDYVRTAWSKGLKERVVVTRHALKNALIPVLTLVGILLGAIVGGNVILETLYGIPGIGFFVVSSVRLNDFPSVQGVVLTVAVILVFINLLVDITYAWLDPRIRYA